MALDSEPRYFQAAKVTALSQAAARAGASWVVPFDADEFWFAKDRSLGQFLRDSDAGVITARLFNVFPQEAGMAWRLDPQPGDLPKIAFRPHRLARLAVGNHWITHPGRPEYGLYIAHYPWRSPEQLRLKTNQGAQALTAKQRAEGTGGTGPRPMNGWKALGPRSSTAGHSSNCIGRLPAARCGTLTRGNTTPGRRPE